ncbi:MAG: signal peptidase I [Eubacterium sp.]|jgi:signal peptidase I
MNSKKHSRGDAGREELQEIRQKTETPQHDASGQGLPSAASIKEEYTRVTEKRRFWGTIRSSVFVLIVVAAVAVLVAVMLLPILKIYGKSMHGTLDNGNIVISLKGAEFETGDIIAFYYNNNILVKRVIATSGEWVNIDKSGNVYVNQKKIDEPYLSSKAYGETNIDLPYQVPEGKVFVMGDNRKVSIDSRSTAIGCVSQEQIVGKIVFRIWPLSEMGTVG